MLHAFLFVIAFNDCRSYLPSFGEVCGIDVEYLIDGKDLFVSIYEVEIEQNELVTTDEARGTVLI